MKILILGGTSMIGHRLWLDLKENHEVIATVRKKHPKLPFTCIENMDAFNFDTIKKQIHLVKPHLVINCIGLIKQIDASKNYIKSIEVNALFPHKIAEVCNHLNIRMIQFGTDCVFSGNKGMYKEQDFADAQDLYGRSKFLGEVDYLENVFTFRTSFIGRELNPKGGLVEWLIAQNGKTIKGFKGAIYSGFPTHQISKIINDHVIPQPELNGVHHISSNPISKYNLLRLIKDLYKLKIEIQPEEHFQSDKSLDSTLFQNKTGFTPPEWESMINELKIDDQLYQNITGG